MEIIASPTIQTAPGEIEVVVSNSEDCVYAGDSKAESDNLFQSTFLPFKRQKCANWLKTSPSYKDKNVGNDFETKFSEMKNLVIEVP